ncbi:hypothetical protein GOB81_04090 [Acetobacter sp. LMG 1627]|uniref:Uncharacterized protein n=1 Tax=Acetobacter conturbans TaxID=1737472 RepID=A0ABX0K0J1_9PROT|nr:hypothetical protein [Acetobacter conturbans]
MLKTTLLGLALSSTLTFVAGPIAAATHAPRHKAKQNADMTDLSSGVTSRTSHPKSLESQEQAPPPPDGYEPVEDIDETIEAHYSLDIRKAQHGSSLPSIEAQQIPRDANNGATPFDVFGVPVKFIAPVAAPYNAASTYRTYAGQSGRGQDAVGAASAAGEP